VLVLFMYLLWSTFYIINLIIFKFFFLKKLFNKNSSLIKLLLLLFFNRNLSFYRDELSFLDIQAIDYERFNNYSILYTIHRKINFIFSNTKLNKITFKNNYKLFKYLNSRNLELNLIKLNMFDSTINYSIIQNVIKISTNFDQYNSYLLVYLNLYKNSLSSNLIDINTILLKKINNSLNLIFKNNLNSISFKTNNYLVKRGKINLTNYINTLNNIKNYTLTINELFLNNIKSTFNISFSASNIIKYISDISINKSMILFLRKNKIFNKSRYSRNRQTYRTGAYWCLYINIIAVIAFYFWFYNFTMNFGYVWWLLYSFILSFFLFKAIKFNFYNIKTLLGEFKLSSLWLFSILSQIFKFLNSIISFLLINQKIIYLLNNYRYSTSSLQVCKKLLFILYRINDLIYSKLN